MKGGYKKTEQIYNNNRNATQSFKIVYHVFENIPLFNIKNSNNEENLNELFNSIYQKVLYYNKKLNKSLFNSSTTIKEKIEEDDDNIIIFMEFESPNFNTILGYIFFNINFKQITLIRKKFILESRRNIEFTSKELEKGYYIPCYIYSRTSFTTTNTRSDFVKTNNKDAENAFLIIKNRINNFTFGKYIWDFFKEYLNSLKTFLSKKFPKIFKPIYNIYFFITNDSAPNAFTYHIKNGMKMLYKQLYDFLTNINPDFFHINITNNSFIYNQLMKTNEGNEENEENEGNKLTGQKRNRKNSNNNKTLQSPTKKVGGNDFSITKNTNNLNYNNKFPSLNSNFEIIFDFYEKQPLNNGNIKKYKDLPRLDNNIINIMHRSKKSNHFFGLPLYYVY